MGPVTFSCAECGTIFVGFDESQIPPGVKVVEVLCPTCGTYHLWRRGAGLLQLPATIVGLDLRVFDGVTGLVVPSTGHLAA
jgi:predicted RNA-binding Zn-ribbon protein involved in translation (DUF1610 family)